MYFCETQADAEYENFSKTLIEEVFDVKMTKIILSCTPFYNLIEVKMAYSQIMKFISDKLKLIIKVRITSLNNLQI